MTPTQAHSFKTEVQKGLHRRAINFCTAIQKKATITKNKQTMNKCLLHWLPLRKDLLPDFKVNKDARSSGTLCLITSNMNNSKRLS